MLSNKSITSCLLANSRKTADEFDEAGVGFAIQSQEAGMTAWWLSECHDRETDLALINAYSPSKAYTQEHKEPLYENQHNAALSVP